ncbi:MAG TPA: ABC transporter substrate-binding protein [bacterium]|nr:ABC transporter substrate-binding protein [bacterium]
MRPLARASTRYRLTMTLLLPAMVAIAGVCASLVYSTGTGAAAPVPLGTGLPSVSEDASIAAAVPAALRAKGVLVVASDASYPPFESFAPDGKTIIGFDADLAHAIGAVLGLKAQMTNVSFDEIIPGLAAKKYDIAMSSIGDTKKREEVVDFVTYYWNGTGIAVPTGNPKHLSTDNLCGARVGVERGTLQQTSMLPADASACQARGKPAPIAEAFKDANETLLALASGRVDAVLADAVTLDYAASKSSSKFAVAGPIRRNPSPGGVAIPKGSGLADPIHRAIAKLMANGTYKAIVNKWGLHSIAIDSSAINGALQ